MNTNIHTTGVLGEQTEKGAEKIFRDIIAKNFPSLGNKGKATIYHWHKATT